MRRRARQPATFLCFVLGVVTFVGGALVLEWRYTFGIGLLLMVLPLTHVVFGTYDRRPE